MENLQDVFVAADDIIAVLTMSDGTVGDEFIGNFVEHVTIGRVIEVEIVMPIPAAFSYCHWREARLFISLKFSNRASARLRSVSETRGVKTALATYSRVSKPNLLRGDAMDASGILQEAIKGITPVPLRPAASIDSVRAAVRIVQHRDRVSRRDYGCC